MSAAARDFTGPAFGNHTLWQRATKRTPCQVCTGTKGCSVAPNGDIICLRVQSDEPVTFGLGGWWHRGNAPLPADRRYTPTPSTPKPETASSEVRDRVNRRLVELFPLSAEHLAYVDGLHQRADLGALYGSLPPGDDQGPRIATLVKEFGFDLLCTVPGFIIRNGHLRLNGAGLLVAIYDVAGLLIGFQVRYGPGDYHWLSTSNGPSTGAPAHLAHPGDVRDRRVAVIVESPKTANILADHLGCVVVATAGHANHKVAGGPLEHLLVHEGVESVIVGLDADDPDAKALTVEQVERSRQQLAAMAHGLGFHVKIARWTHADGKGPDDLLLSGHTWDLTVYRPTAATNAPEHDDGPGSAPGMAGTVRIQREALQRARAMNDALTRAYGALRRLLLTEQFTESEKKMLVWTLQEKYGYCFGLPIPETFVSVYIKEDEMPRAGLSVNSFRTARQRLVKDDVFIEATRQPSEQSKTGCPYKVITVNGERLERLIVNLDNDAGAQTQTEERAARAAARAEEARARYNKAQETRERREEQDRATRQQLASIGHERRRFAEVTEQLSHQLTEKEAEADAMHHAAVDAQREAQRIIEQAKRDSIPCRGCGVLIAIEDYRCDDCRAEGTDADRFKARELDTTFGCNGNVGRASLSHKVPMSAPIHPKVGDKSPSPVQSSSDDLRPCYECGVTLTRHGLTCKPCRVGARPVESLHIPEGSAATAQGVHS